MFQTAAISEVLPMAPAKSPGPLSQTERPLNVHDGTSPRSVAPGTGSINGSLITQAQETLYSTWYVHKAFALSDFYEPAYVAKQIGDDFQLIAGGIIGGIVTSVGIMAASTLVGGAIGAGVGALGFGVGAAPGAAIGAEAGFAIGEDILALLGLQFLIQFVAMHLMPAMTLLQQGVLMAWNSHGSPARIDAAAQMIADGKARVMSLVIEGLVSYIAKQAAKGALPAALKQLSSSKLFQKAGGLLDWIKVNYPRLRAKYTNLPETQVLEEGPLIPGSSIPESMTIRVGYRTFKIWRDATKGAFKDPTKPIGPALKHMGEIGAKANVWSKFSQTDFPISALAGGLDYLEARLTFEPPGLYKINMRSTTGTCISVPEMGEWEFEVDTSAPIWTIRHVQYGR